MFSSVTPDRYAYEKQANVQVRVARIFNTFGPRMHPNDGRVVSNFIIQVLWSFIVDYLMDDRHFKGRILQFMAQGHKHDHFNLLMTL